MNAKEALAMTLGSIDSEAKDNAMKHVYGCVERAAMDGRRQFSAPVCGDLETALETVKIELSKGGFEWSMSYRPGGHSSLTVRW